RADAGLGPLQKRGNPRRGELHGCSARLWVFLGKTALHKQGEPGDDLLIKLRDAAYRGIVFADDCRVLIWVEVKRIRDVYRIGKHIVAALAVDQVVRRVDVQLTDGRQALRLESEIDKITGERRLQAVALGAGLAGGVERVAQCDLEPLADALGNGI